MDKVKFLMLGYREDLKALKFSLKKETEEDNLEKTTVSNFCQNGEIKDLVKGNEKSNLYQALDKIRPELNLIPPSKLIFTNEKKQMAKEEV